MRGLWIVDGGSLYSLPLCGGQAPCRHGDADAGWSTQAAKVFDRGCSRACTGTRPSTCSRAVSGLLGCAAAGPAGEGGMG